MIRTGFQKIYLLSLCLFSEFRLQFLSAVNGLRTSSSKGLFVDSCYAHCQTEMQETWLRTDSPLLDRTVRWTFLFSICSSFLICHYIFHNLLNLFRCSSLVDDLQKLIQFLYEKKNILQTIAKAVGDWFYDRSSFQKIDCPYPCNPTCHNRVFDPKEHPNI
jgi:hypothetical protein